MKNSELLILGAAAVAVYLMMKSARLASANQVNNIGAAVGGVSQIYTGATAGSAGAGWRYFTDGTSISPSGVYYKDGVVVWSPTA